MYDKFQLKLEATQVLIGPSVSETRERLGDTGDKGFHVVDRINVAFTVQLSIVPKTPNIPKIRISGHLPVLHASASDAKWKSFMRLVNVAIPNFDDEQEVPDKAIEPARTSAATKEVKRPRAQSSLSQRRKSHRQSTSFPFAAQQAVVIEESDIDDDEEAVFQDASIGQTDEDLKLAQRIFELSFSIGRLQGSLYRSDPNGKKSDQLLVELVAEHFSVDVTVRPFDITAEVSLQSLSLDDHVEKDPLPEFKRLISSGEDAEGGDEEKALVQVKYARIKRESPEFMTKYSGIETNLDIAISTINLIVDQKSVV